MKKIIILLILLLLYIQAFSLPYKRNDYMRKWLDIDKDCQNTRHEVLIRESLVPVTFKTTKKCQVISGLWYDEYTGRFFLNPSLLDIDHVVPLKEVNESGGNVWSKQQKSDYANDLRNLETLMPVYRSENRSKGSKSPDQWMPKNTKYHCRYIKTWVLIKQKYELNFDKEELKKIVEVFTQC